MEKDLEFLKKFKSKQSDIEAKLEQLESVQHENENLDKAISQAQQRVSLLTGDIQKEEQDNVNFMLKSALKDVEICAAKHLVQETSDEIVVQKSRLLKAKGKCITKNMFYVVLSMYFLAFQPWHFYLAPLWCSRVPMRIRYTYFFEIML